MVYVIYVPWGDFKYELKVSRRLNLGIFDRLHGDHYFSPGVFEMVPD